jgi:hypothetical protein
MIILLILVVVVALSLVYHKYIGLRAMRFTSIDVGGLTQERLIEIGTKASGSVVKRLIGRTETFQYPDGAIGWDAPSRGGVMTFRVESLPGGNGFRVGGCATTVKAARMRGYMNPDTSWGRAKIMTNWLCLILGIPQNARVLLARRRRALRAIARAGVVIGSAADQRPVPGGQGPAEPTTPLPEAQ